MYLQFNLKQSERIEAYSMIHGDTRYLVLLVIGGLCCFSFIYCSVFSFSQIFKPTHHTAWTGAEQHYQQH